MRITVSALRKGLGEPWVIATMAGVGYCISTQPCTEGEGEGGGSSTRSSRPPETHHQLRRLCHAGGCFTARRRVAVPPALRPRACTDATRFTATGALSHRVGLQGRRDEFRELADAYDSMLGRLEAHVAGEQRFAADAFHELRTPLAITQALVDMARNDPEHDSVEFLPVSRSRE